MRIARTGPGKRRETPQQRLDRLWGELLREVRVALAGVQLLFVFLLAVAFTPLFPRLGESDRLMYVVCLLLGAAATGLLTAPVSIHRMVTGRGMKYEAVTWASRFTIAGLAILLCMVALGLLLVLRSVTALSDRTALILDVAVVGGLTLCWLVPAVLMRRGSTPTPVEDPEEHGQDASEPPSPGLPEPRQGPEAGPGSDEYRRPGGPGGTRRGGSQPP
jgi:hypothetical protein